MALQARGGTSQIFSDSSRIDVLTRDSRLELKQVNIQVNILEKFHFPIEKMEKKSRLLKKIY